MAILVGTLIAWLAACGHEQDPNVVATVGDRPIRLADVQAEMVRRRTGRSGSDPDAVLEDLIHRQALLAKARRLELHLAPELIRACENLLISRLKEVELTPQLEKLEISDAEIRHGSRDGLSKYPVTNEVRLAMIFLKTHPKMSAAKTAELSARINEARRKALAQPNAGSSFGSIALEYSDDQATRYQGGDLGWLEPARDRSWRDSKALAAGFSLKNVGDITEVIQGSDGFYLLKLTDRRDPTLARAAEMSETVRHRLQIEKRRALEESFTKEACATIRIQRFPEVLERVKTELALTGQPTQNPPAVP